MKVVLYSKFPNYLIDETQVPIFCTTRYAKYLRDTKHLSVSWFAGFISDMLVCLIPFATAKRTIFRKGLFLTSVVNIGNTNEILEKEFVDTVIDYIRENKICDWIQQPPTWALFRTVPSNSKYCEFGTYRIDLEDKTEDELFNNLDKVTRRRIKKAMNDDNISIEKGIDKYKNNLMVFSGAVGSGVPDMNEMNKLTENLSGNLMCYSAFCNNAPQTCAIVIYDKLCAYGLYFGSIRKPLNGSNYLLVWEAIKEAKQRGLKYFDFVGARVKPKPGSKSEGNQKFKEHFGVEFHKGFIWKMPISKLKYSIFEIILKIFLFFKFKKYGKDIIEQELKRDKVKEVTLTIDYEVFLGKETGSVKECMIEPTDKLISFLKNNNSKMTVFWDVLHYYRLHQLENDFPELKEDKSLIKRQILELAEKGHDIQLHIHPHWLDAKYENGKWVFKYDRFSLHKLSAENEEDNINTIIGCFTIAKNLMQDLIRKTNPDYKITTFRAGAYLIEPFNKLKDAFIENDIKIDSSVCPDFSNDNHMFSFDFSNYPTEDIYRFDSTLKKTNDEGEFVEIPITTVKIPVLKNLIFTVIRKLKYPNLENARKGIGSGYSINSTKKSILGKLLHILIQPKVTQFTTDGNFKEKFNYIFKQVPENSTMILHPKLLNEHTLNLIREYIRNGEVKFMSISDRIRTSGSSIINERETVEKLTG